MSDKEAVDQLVLHYKELKDEIHKVIIGQDEVVDQVLISIFSKPLLIFFLYFQNLLLK